MADVREHHNDLAGSGDAVENGIALTRSEMTLHQLRIFWAVAHAETLTKAAKQLGLTQPSLSQQLSKLETTVGARLFDVYEGPSLPEGKRSLAFAVHFQSPDKTLTDAEVADARRRLVRRLEHEIGAELRGSG